MNSPNASEEESLPSSMVRGTWKMLRKLIPQSILGTLRNYKTLSVRHGQFLSMRLGESLDGAMKPVPWYTYPAIEYLRQLDFSDLSVFEYGSGNSTLFWAERCRTIVSVESDPEWYARIRDRCPGNVDYRLLQEEDAYANSIEDYDHTFDVVLIDGIARRKCARATLEKLSSSGFVVLDNSDREADTAAMLRDASLIEVDMTGFGPINNYPWTTSFFFTRDVRLKPRHDRQPVHGVGTPLHY